MFLPCCLHVLCKTRYFQVDCLRIYVFFVHKIHKQKGYCLSFAQILSLLVSIPEFMMECKTDGTSNVINVLERNRPELIHCPVMKDQWDCVPEWPWRASEVKNFSWWVGTILKSFSSSFCHCALPLFIRPMLRLRKMIPKIIFLISRIQSLHHLLEVDYHDEEGWSVSSTLDNRWTNNLVVQYRSTFFPKWVQFLWMSWQKYVFVVLL